MYRIGKYRFETKKEAQAGIRDAKKMAALKKVGDSELELAENYLRQITDQKISFETYVGQDFVKKLKRVIFERRFDGSDIELTEVEVLSKGRRWVRTFFLALLYLMAFAVGGAILYWVYDDISSKNSLAELRERVYSESEAEAEATFSLAAEVPKMARTDTESGGHTVLHKFQSLYAKNPDFVGWLCIPGTKIDYPVMYRDGDNDFYLSHDFYGEEDRSGLLVLDKRCDRNAEAMNVLIHGHNMSSGLMFGELMEYKSEAYYRNHPYIEYSNLYENRKYEIVSVFLSNVNDADEESFRYYDYIHIEDAASYEAYIKSAVSDTLYDTGVTATYPQRLITLSTCDYSYFPHSNRLSSLDLWGVNLEK